MLHEKITPAHSFKPYFFGVFSSVLKSFANSSIRDAVSSKNRSTPKGTLPLETVQIAYKSGDRISVPNVWPLASSDCHALVYVYFFSPYIYSHCQRAECRIGTCFVLSSHGDARLSIHVLWPMSSIIVERKNINK